MADFEQAMEKAISEGVTPGAALVATNRDGTFTYSKVFASCTKLQTSICCTQLVERGLVTLDEPVYKHIPELKEFPVLKGFKDDGSPIEEPHKSPITLRTLLTHTSGFTYESIHPLTIQWLKYKGRGPSNGSTVLDRFARVPLVFEPGAGWMYGPSLDFAGLLLERIMGYTLEEYMKENLWKPLGIKDMTFFLSKRLDLMDRLADMSVRGEDGKLAHGDASAYYTDGKGNERKGCMGGDAIFASAAEYIKILHAVLTTDTEEKILKKETLEEFFRPQLGEVSVAVLNTVLQDDMTNNAMGGSSREVARNWGLGGLLIMGDAPDGKREGTMIWGGLPNLTWFADRKTGLCGLYACQVMPPGDAQIAALQRKFEASMYKKYGESHDEGPRL